MRILFSIMSFAALFVVYIRFVESRSVFFPSIGRSDAVPTDLGMAYEDVYLKTADDVRIHGWFVPSARRDGRTLTVLFFHGNAGNVGARVEKLRMLHGLGVNVFIIDYRGYGKSEGRPSEQGIYLDARAAFDYLVRRGDVAPGRIVSFGVSLGGTVAADLAVHRPVCGLILESTFTSAREMARKILPIAPPFLIRTHMDSIEKIARVRVPVLVIHSMEDEMVPFAMGRRMFEAAPEPKEFLQLRGGHNEVLFADPAAYARGMRVFLEKYF